MPLPTPTPTPTPMPKRKLSDKDAAAGKDNKESKDIKDNSPKILSIFPTATPTPQPSSSYNAPGPVVAGPVVQQTVLDLFLQDKAKRHIIVMGVPTSIDTTEVGVFFEPTGAGETRVEISSLSTNAKTRAAEIIFAELEKSFAVVPQPAAGDKPR
jgi:hypothetical protein